ncbi:hypothetical protein B5P41_30730, partial [Bacillus sp. SRB_28]
FVEVGDMHGNIGFAIACKFAQDGSTFVGFGKQGIGKALEAAPLFIRGRSPPEFVFVFADGLHAVSPYHRHDQGLGNVGLEQGVATRQEVEASRGVPPSQDQGILGRMLTDSGRQCGKL